MSKEETLIEVPSYIDGEKFVCSLPANLAELDCKLNPKVRWYDLLWSPWPTEKGIVRRVGGFLLKLHETETDEHGWGASRKFVPVKVIQEVGGDPSIWYQWNLGLWNEKGKERRKLPSFNGRHVLSVLSEDFPELKDPGYGVSNEERNKSPFIRKHAELRTPAPISEEILTKVFGRSQPTVEIGHTNFEHANRINKFQLDVEWYRKELLKIQRKMNNDAKKEKAQELGVSVADIEEQKRKEAEIARAALLTKEWVDISKEVFKTIDFLNDVVRQMGQRQPLDRKWFDEGRREMRELANVMRPLNKHFAKDED